MSFLVNKLSYYIASGLGISAFVFPEAAPWSLLATLLIGLISIGHASKYFRVITLLVSTCLFISVAGGHLSASFITAALSAIVIAPRNRLLALVILALQTSYAASIEAIAANYLASIHMEALAPALVSSVLLFFIQPKLSWWHGCLFIAGFPIIWLAHYVGLQPYGIMYAAGAASLGLSMLTPIDNQPKLSSVGSGLIACTIGLIAIGWAITPPKFPNAGYVVLPEVADSPEARFYSNYQEVLQFAGFSAEVVSSVESIPSNSLVVLPWLTAPEHPIDRKIIDRIRELALEREWIVVMVGEHTNMGGVATKIETITQQPLLRNDLSVPKRNTDDSGHMRIADMRSWYPKAMLNRGASVAVSSPLTRILLSGDGWWAEPDIGEWLWVGDYNFFPEDRHGRLVMAAAKDHGKARWVVIGDTGPFINEQLVTDPRPAARILELATLLPLFLKDVALVTLAATVLIPLSSGLACVTLGIMVIGFLFSTGGSRGHWISSNEPWRSLWRQESAFDERNFNRSLIQSPTLLTTDWTLRRPSRPLTNILPTSNAKTVTFGLVEGQLVFGTAVLSQCKRLGSIWIDDIKLMDSQACKISGDADILVGDKDGAAVLKIGTHILILDQNFLGRNSPPDNRVWLEAQLK